MSIEDAQNKKARALQFKEEGNALFAQQKYAEAAEKYTLAIELDDTNAIYFTNRSTSKYHLEQYVESVADADKATEIDPSYLKGWMRLAQAQQQLGMYLKAQKSWEKAQSRLPSRNLTDADRRLKTQIQAGLQETSDKLRELQNPKQFFGDEGGNFGLASNAGTPWGCARSMVTELQASSNYRSSAWVIAGAYKEWEQALRVISSASTDAKSLPLHDFFDGPGLKESSTLRLVHALLRTTRVFHLPPTEPQLLDKINSQMVIETVQSETASWGPMDAPAIVADVKKRLQTQGWETLGIGLAVIISCRVARGFLNYTFMKNFAAAVRWYGMAVDMVELCRKEIKDPPGGHSGSVFKSSFLRGLKTIRMNAYLAAFGSQKPGNAQFSLAGLKALAEELLSETEADLDSKPVISDGETAGSVLPFWDYAIAVSLATKAYCLKVDAKSRLSSQRPPKPEDRSILLEAAKLYIQAAANIPKDDEVYTMYLYYGLTCYWDAREPLSATLPLLRQIRDELPAVNRIWEATNRAKGMDTSYNYCSQYLTKVEKNLKKGKVKASSAVAPDFPYN